MLQQDKTWMIMIGTGDVRQAAEDFRREALALLDLTTKTTLELIPPLYHQFIQGPLVGDPAKAKKVLKSETKTKIPPKISGNHGFMLIWLNLEDLFCNLLFFYHTICSI